MEIQPSAGGRVSAGSLILLIATQLGLCQDGLHPAKLPEFDVVSVKPSGTTFVHAPANQWVTLSVRGFQYTPTRVTCDQPLIAFLREAYSLKSWQIDAPAWLQTEKYDFEAVMPAGTPREEVHLMIRAMLAARFGLKAHIEQKMLPTYALVVGKRGFHLTPITNPGPDSVRSEAGHLAATAVSIQWFAKYLNASADRPVIDDTGIQGKFNITLSWTSDYDSSGSIKRDRGILEVIEPMLGLKLEERRTPTPVLVVDHVERTPTPN